MNKIEDEYHHCVECPKFDKIRKNIYQIGLITVVECFMYVLKNRRVN